MQAADVMSRDVVTVAPDTAISEAARLMIAHRVSGLPVLSSGRLVGMLTEGDLLRRTEIGTERPIGAWRALLTAAGRLADDYAHAHARKVSDAMTGEVVSAAPETSLAEIVALMEARRIKRIPILEGERLVGLISRADLLRALTGLLAPVTGPAMSDLELRRAVLAEIDRQPWAPRACVDAKVAHGIVELTGAVTDRREREALRVLVENVPGVRRVIDQIAWIDAASGTVIEGPPDS